MAGLNDMATTQKTSEVDKLIEHAQEHGGEAHGVAAHAEHAEHAGHAAGPHIAIAAEQLGAFMGLPITNTLITSWLVMGFLILTAYLLNRKLSLTKPSQLQNILEFLFEYILEFVTEVLESRKKAAKFFPLLATIFLFVWMSNWAEFIPGVGSITFHDHPFLRSVNTDLNVTIALALISFVVIEISGIRALGWSYAKKFVNFSSPLNFFVGLIELVSELARLISFSFRLFGNIFAGEVLIAVTVFFIPLLMPVPLIMFELFVGFIQAAVFALLTLFFIKIAMTPAEH